MVLAALPVSYGGRQLIIDEARRQVTVGGQPAALTATEWKLLTTLASVPGRVYSRYELINRTRGYEYDGYERTIDSHIRNLRRKIEPGPHAHQLIETVTGAGYRLAITRDHKPTAPAARLDDAHVRMLLDLALTHPGTRGRCTPSGTAHDRLRR
jgi:DNA-binding winged helix-turn-helix (wHTH) protein